MTKFLAIVGAGVLGLVSLAALVAAWIFATMPSADELKGCMTTAMYKVHLCDKDPGFAQLDSISPFIIGAVIMSEDASFYSHEGVDMNELKESAIKDFNQGRFARGGSTITQQLAKNVFTSGEKSIIRKLQELYLATQIEKIFTKNRILTLYLNVVEFAPNVYGVKAASRHYFGKEPLYVLPEEAAFLAFLLPNPKKYSQSFDKKQLTPFASKSVKTILHKMFLGKKITEAEYEGARANVPNLFGGNETAMKDVKSEDADDNSVPWNEFKTDPDPDTL